MKDQSQNGQYPDHQFAQTILDSISAHVAILDKEGNILETNRAWKRFAEENQINEDGLSKLAEPQTDHPPTNCDNSVLRTVVNLRGKIGPRTENINYLEVCEKAAGIDGDFGFIATGIREVIAGQKVEFAMDYPCHSDTEKRWFYMRVVLASGPGPLRVVVSHENITALKLMQEKIEQNEQELLEEKRRLEEANTALKVLLRQHDIDRRELEENVLDNIRQLVVPISQKLAELKLPDPAKDLLTTLDTRLLEVTKPFLQRVAAVHAILTPQEIEIATLIREGLSSKEIAERLNISLVTVNFHRRNLRKKLKLDNTRKNLRSYLVSLAE